MNKIMKKFYCYLSLLSAILSLTLVACSEEPATEQTTKEYDLELTSGATMEFSAEGGEGLIEWRLIEVTRTNVVAQLEPTFATEAEWIALDAETLGAFTVAANEGEARDAVITVTYLEQVIDVTVKQAANASETVELAQAIRFSSEDVDVPANSFILYFTDEAESFAWYGAYWF